MAGEGVGELVGRDEEEGAAQAEEEVACDVAVKAAEGRVAQVEGEGHAAGAQEEDGGGQEVAGAPAVVVEDVACQHCAHVQGDGGQDEEEVEAHVLLRARHLALLSRRGRPVRWAEGAVDALGDEDRFQRREAADYA